MAQEQEAMEQLRVDLDRHLQQYSEAAGGDDGSFPDDEEAAEALIKRLEVRL